ncbi:threonine-phosphate decarboxylase CobD [Rhizobium sp. 0TCS1.26]|uniref:threonine-phosphate decarboxylase CobD n=1 Tax=Rhizobium sp. 0TCS1.26 TaxID=3142623 RepID=UPI003D2BEC0D
MDLKQGKQDGQAIEHGGNLARAQQMFPDAPTPWIDLSTGINPHSYPYSPPPATAFSRLPEPADLACLKGEAARAYGAPSADHLAAAPGTHILLPLIIEAVFGPSAGAGRTAAILSPTYAEHARLARLCGFTVNETAHFEDMSSADLAIVVNPNNPDGRLFARDDLLALSRRLSSKGGLLLVDEAFMEVIAPSHSVVDGVHDGLIVLRSFGKFYGLAGVRLGFAVAPQPIAEWLSARLGPWAIPGPTLHVGREAFRDHAWQAQMCARLTQDAGRLDGLLATAGLNVCGGTSLFRYLRDRRAQAVFEHLGQAGILVRRFSEHPDVLRIGLPGVDGWERLEAALCAKMRHS